MTTVQQITTPRGQSLGDADFDQNNGKKSTEKIINIKKQNRLKLSIETIFFFFFSLGRVEEPCRFSRNLKPARPMTTVTVDSRYCVSVPFAKREKKREREKERENEGKGTDRRS